MRAYEFEQEKLMRMQNEDKESSVHMSTQDLETNSLMPNKPLDNPKDEDSDDTLNGNRFKKYQYYSPNKPYEE